VLGGGKALQSRFRGRIRIKTSYWGYRLKGEVFVNVNVKAVRSDYRLQAAGYR